MKKTSNRLHSLFAALAALILAAALAVPAFAVEGGFADLYYRVFDDAEVLTEDEDNELEDALEELSLRQSFDGVGDGRSAGSGGQSSDAALERCDALFKHVLCGVREPAVDVARVAKGEAVRRVLRVVEDIGSRRVDRDGAGIGGGVGLFLTDVELQSFKMIVGHNNFSFFESIVFSFVDGFRVSSHSPVAEIRAEQRFKDGSHVLVLQVLAYLSTILVGW